MNQHNRRYIKENKEKILKYGIIALIFIVGLGLFVFDKDDDEILITEETQASDKQNEKKEEISKMLVVDVGGAVTNPDVVELESGSRVEDAIDAAGGLMKNADTSQINRAAPVEDGEKIYIPFRGESNPTSGSSQPTGGENAGKVNINLADSAALQTLERIGPVTAEKIIAYREKHGKFKKLTDIKKVDGIGDKTYENLKDKICL